MWPDKIADKRSQSQMSAYISDKYGKYNCFGLAIVDVVEDIPSMFGAESDEESDMGQFRITCMPAIRGWNLLHITVCGQHIRGSPFEVNAY